MAGTAPIKLGSAAGTFLVFEGNSTVTTSTSGIQSCAVKALWGDGSTVYTKIPAAGVGFSTVFGNSYLPADFKVDYTDSPPQVEYLDARLARVTITFKRPDPNATGTASRQVHVDSVLNYKSLLSSLYIAPIYVGATGDPFVDIVGFPEPVVTVTYNTTTPPSIGGGTLASLYALPGDSRAAGFPPIIDLDLPFSVTIAAGTIVTYLGPGGTFIGPVTLAANTKFTYTLLFKSNPLGWQLTKLKYDPVAAATTYDVEETWRDFYVFTGVTFVSRVPP